MSPQHLSFSHNMLSVDEALQLVQQSVRPLAPRRVRLGDALGLKLAEAVTSEVDSPPFDKSMLDGYAIDVDDRSRERKILETVIAGQVPQHNIQPGTTVHVMTGAPVPAGTEAVVKHEDTTLLSSATVQLPETLPAAGYGIFRQGSSFRRGDEVLGLGKRLRPVDLALAAEVGKSELAVIPRPLVAVLATGNELVPCDQPMSAGQIRNSNGPMLLAALREAGAEVVDLGIARDVVEELRYAITAGLEADVLLITGGVSAGVMDLVPQVLGELDVGEVFHKVRMKPGKPLWFGRKHHDQHPTLVFGLPGNPVSTLVSFQLFVKPSLTALGGDAFGASSTCRGRLSATVTHRGDRPTYHPCTLALDVNDSQYSIEPLAWRGSADLAALTQANGLIVLPSGNYELLVGTVVEALEL